MCADATARVILHLMPECGSWVFAICVRTPCHCIGCLEVRLQVYKQRRIWGTSTECKENQVRLRGPKQLYHKHINSHRKFKLSTHAAGCLTLKSQAIVQAMAICELHCAACLPGCRPLDLDRLGRLISPVALPRLGLACSVQNSPQFYNSQQVAQGHTLYRPGFVSSPPFKASSLWHSVGINIEPGFVRDFVW